MKELSKLEIRDKYNQYAKWYDLVEGIAELIFRKYRRELMGKAHGKVLEVGIGSGRNLRYYPKDCEIYGIDVSKEMLKRAGEKAEGLGIKIRLKEADAEKLPFKKGEFDCVVDTLGLCTYPNPIKALKEMKRVCKRDGKILLLEHGESSNSFITRWQKKREPKHSKIAGCHLLRNHTAIAKRAGLKIANEKRGFFGIVYVIEI